nr:centrosomal protein of 290 kDa [Leptinotarsa decemlineata]
MDWKYILALNIEEIHEEEKEELYNIVTWFEYEKEEVDLDKLKVLFRVSQEILKYKGVQVETLLHELEEIALKKDEEEARKQDSDTEPRSIRSRKSNSLEYENLEQKYLELRSKLKKMVKTNEKKDLEISKLSNKVKLLGQENRRLQIELQSGIHDMESESDVSETGKEQRNQLLESLNTKNKQISDLLMDIEGVEKENFALRQKISKVKDELLAATEEMTSVTKTLESKEKCLKEYTDKLEKMEFQYNDLKKNFNDLHETKNRIENNFQEKLIELNSSIKVLENVNEQKNEEIEHLKTLLKEPSVNSSISSLPKDDAEQSHLSALQRALSDRDNQLLEVRTQLQDATKEMKESTELLKKMKMEKENDSRKKSEMEETITEMKTLLNTAHERSQKLQNELAFSEENVKSKENELQKIYSKMRENGQVDLVANLEEIQELKFHNRTKQKQIMSLVKTANKLQERCDKFEKENFAMREQIGLSQEDVVNLNGYTSKMKIMKKELDTVRDHLLKKEEQWLHLKIVTHKLNQTISSLANQLLDLGQKPKYDNLKEFVSREENLREDNKVLCEENEALRKGMHEILNSINTKKTTSLNEIKSETFEKLIRALDVKHISGWYHPAMRLQAELHHLEGINSELRDQLRLAKAEALKFREISFKDKKEEKNGSEKDGRITEKQILEANTEVLEIVYQDELTTENAEPILNNILEKATVCRESGEIDGDTRKLLITLFGNVLVVNHSVKQKLQSTEESLQKLENEHELLLEKLNILDSETEEEKIIKFEEVVKSNVFMKRQIIYLENEMKKLLNKLDKKQEDSNNALILYTKSIGEMERKNKSLEMSLTIMKNMNDISVDFETHSEVLKNLDDMTIKYRELAAFIKKKEEENSLEMNILLEVQKNLESDKIELKSELISTLSKLTFHNVQTRDHKLESISQKLAESEVNEITERQRANHINNLYDLVKEQLNKSEERFHEFTKYNEDLLKKNMVLQGQLREAESKICNFVDNNLYNQLKRTNNDLLSEKEKLENLVSNLKQDLKLIKTKQFNETTWNDSKEQELLNLKHQIVDLISSSDEKVTIAQLNEDIMQYRHSHNYYESKYEEMRQALEELKLKYDEEMKNHEKEKTLAEEKIVILNQSMNNLRLLFNTLKLQYFGSVPLCSEKILINNIKTINEEKHESFLRLHKARVKESEATLLKEQLKIELECLKEEQKGLTKDCEEYQRQVLNWMKEKKVYQINELRHKRQLEFKEEQLQHFMERVKMQDDQIAQLDEELLFWHKNFDDLFLPKQKDFHDIGITETSTRDSPTPVKSLEISKSFKSVEVQVNEGKSSSSIDETQLSTLLADLSRMKGELSQKQQVVDQMKSKITEHEMTISLFRKQIGDKQSQITFYERHILELQNKKAEIHVNGAGGDNINARVERTNSTNEDFSVLTDTVKTLQDNLKMKNEEIVKYQTLLKEDRDKHSMAAAILQEELQNIQKLLTEEKQKKLSLEQNFTKSRPNRAALEQYMSQVHALEKHTSELHTKISSLEAQLQSTREEVVRWRTLANDRLSAMEELRKSLDSQHQNELDIYKSDSEKLKELGKDEVISLRQLISEQKMELSGRLEADIRKVVKEKDDKIHELTIKLRHLRNTISPNTARSDKSNKSMKDQLQKKITTQENELAKLKETLAEQIAINETHRIQANEDFYKWKKMKYWQQNAEKLKNKLAERDAEFEKLQHTTTGYRMLIERLEREKHNLENRIKILKSTNVNIPNFKELEILRIENMKLKADVEAMNSKLEMQQHHSGGLGAAMMQEKLESQERKIAILEVAAKVCRDKIKHQTTVLQAKQLVQKIPNPPDASKGEEEKHPSYIDVLKTERHTQEMNHDVPQTAAPESKKVSELERTIFILKRVVEKLQVENKRLVSGKQPLSDHSASADKLKRNHLCLKKKYEECVQKLGNMEHELSMAKNKLRNFPTSKTTDDDGFVAISDELSKVREQLEQKSTLLDKVKILLHRAATKEKSLIQEIIKLKNEKCGEISTIPEESEGNSSSEL